MCRDDWGLELVGFSQDSPDLNLLQIFSVETDGLSLLENAEDFTTRNRFKMEVEIPPRQLVTKVFKVDLKRKILKGDCRRS